MSFDATIGGKTAISYIAVEGAEVLLTALPQSSGIVDWLNLDDPEKEQTLVAATAALNSLDWAGEICSCDQRLQWPRKIHGCRCGVTRCDAIPYEIQLATSYLAAFLGESGGFTGITGEGGVGGLEPFDQVKIGPIEVKMKDTSTSIAGTTLGQIPPFVADLIREFLFGLGMSQGTMSRRSIARAQGSYIGSASYTGNFRLTNGVVTPRFGGWGPVG